MNAISRDATIVRSHLNAPVVSEDYSVTKIALDDGAQTSGRVVGARAGAGVFFFAPLTAEPRRLISAAESADVGGEGVGG